MTQNLKLEEFIFLIIKSKWMRDGEGLMFFLLPLENLELRPPSPFLLASLAVGHMVRVGGRGPL